jgi:transcriptional regulator with XRE-family HTH domain
MSDEIDFHLGKRMRRRRRLLGLTQQQLANACGVRFQQIQKYECGANRVSAARLWRISEALDVPVGYFFEGLADTIVMAPAVTRDEKPELAHTYRALGETPRRGLLRIPTTIGRDNDAA